MHENKEIVIAWAFGRTRYRVLTTPPPYRNPLARAPDVRLVERPGVAGRDVRALVLAEQLAVVVREDAVVVRSHLRVASVRRRDLHAGLELVLVVGAPAQKGVDGRLAQSSRFCDGRVVGRQARVDGNRRRRLLLQVG